MTDSQFVELMGRLYQESRTRLDAEGWHNEEPLPANKHDTLEALTYTLSRAINNYKVTS